MDIKTLVTEQRRFFGGFSTRPLEFRKSALDKLLGWVRQNEREIQEALKKDLNKGEAEAYLTETSLCLEEIKFAQKNLKSWTKPKKVKSALAQLPAKSYIYPEPLGVVLIIGPWNYPFQLITAPLVAAIAAGNCVVIKPSELAPNTSHLVAKMCKELFEPNFVTVVQGDASVSTELLKVKWDHIFFTGGTKIGQIVMEAAAKHLTPVTLELGGKSPCIVDSECDFEMTVKRIVWGKFMNAGQTCVAPDYVFVPAGFKSKFIELAKKEITRFFGEDPSHSDDYARIISDRHLKRLEGLLKGPEVAIGGKVDEKDRYFSPTVLTEVEWSHPVMQDEIFGPLLPLIEYGTLEEVIQTINSHPKPLALYFFSTSDVRIQEVLSKCSFGGGCINDVLIHLGNPRLPFGGVGPSGMGAYHGEYGFKVFSHYKSVVYRKFAFDLPLRYPPYKDKLKLLKKLLG